MCLCPYSSCRRSAGDICSVSLLFRCLSSLLPALYVYFLMFKLLSLHPVLVLIRNCCHCTLYPVSVPHSVNGPPITRTVARFIQAPAQDPLVCSSTRQCWLQLWVSCTVVRLCCDCTASSAPTTNVLTPLDRILVVKQYRWQQ